MDKYKPGYMGKVAPVEDKEKMTDFVVNQYESFSKAYDAVKESSDKISDVSASTSTDNTYSINVSTDKETIDKISSSNKDKNVNVSGTTVNVTK